MPSGRRKAGAGPSPSDNNSSDDSSSTCSGQRGRGSKKNQGRKRGDHSRGSDDSMSDACSRERVKGNRWLKPEKFDGRGSFETFMYMFENCATYNNWGKKDKLAHLRWSMTGIAAQLLWDSDSLKYSELVEKLRSRFGGKGMEERFQNDLRCRRRAKGESLRELAQDVRRLMALAYPGEKSSLSEHIARDAFLMALEDPEF